MGSSVFIVAEVGSVHDGSLGNALKLIELAAGVGADAVKFQMHIAEAETLPGAPDPPYFSDEPRYAYFERTAFEPTAWQKIKEACSTAGTEFLCSAFSVEAVDTLEALGVTRHKVPSGEVTNLPLLEAMASRGKPVLLSSGMSTWEELDAAVGVVRAAGGDLTILQCTSAYPCPLEDVGLNVMADMRERYECMVGLSDHTLSIHTPVVAATLGARVIEKHLTFSRAMYGSDAKHSLEPDEFAEMVRGIRAAETLVAANVDKDTAAEGLADMKRVFEKSIVSVADIPKGAVVTSDMLGVKKPGGGLPPRDLATVAGRRARVRIPADTVISLKHLSR